MKRPPIFTAFVACVTAAFATPALAQYRVEQFTAGSGLPQSTISGVAQSADGYLWIGTYDGLVRYDGVTFTVFDRGTTPEMRETQFLNVQVDGAGAVWAGTSTGVLRYRDGAFRWFDPVAGARGGGNPSQATLQREWVARPATGWQLDRGARSLVRVARDGTREAVAIPTADSVLEVAAEDRQGTLWLRTPTAMVRLRDGVFTTFDGQSLVGTPSLRTAFVDRDGTLWVGTNERGLFRVAPQALTTYSASDGIVDHIVYPILQDHAGRVWMGAGGGLTIYQDGKFSSFRIERLGAGPFRYRLAPAVSASDRNGNNVVRSIYEDRAGRVWLSAADAFIALAGEKQAAIVHVVECGCSATAMIQDRAGDLWASGVRTLRRVRGDSIRVYGTADGFPDAATTALHEDAAGTLWIGTRRGLVRKDGERFVTLTAKDGLAGDHIRSITSDPDGTLWVGTFDGGLSRYRKGRFVNITTRDGLFSNGVFEMLDDGGGHVWMSGNQGIFRVARRQLDDFANGKIPAINSVAYGARDGMRSVEANGGRQPAGFRARDGKLWFPTQDGVVVIDPVAAADAVRPPLAILNRVTVDGAVRPVAASVRVAPGQSELEIGYTAPTSVHAQDIRFRYQLAGLDDGWIDAGTSRQVHYSHLPPGHYAFRVIAANSDGTWGVNGASLDVEVDPHFWQATWFLVASALATLAFIAGLYTLRVRGLEAQERLLTRQVAERTADLATANERLQQLAIEDALTGLANKRRLDEFLSQEWQRSFRARTPVSVLMVDVDHFKLYNDQRGHLAGDDCLRRVAAVLGATVRRGTDLAARYGGEEFAIVLDNTPELGAPVVAETIRARVEALAIPHGATGAGPLVTVSIGAATMMATDGATTAELVAAADAALYRAKAAGRNRVAGRGAT